MCCSLIYLTTPLLSIQFIFYTVLFQIHFCHYWHTFLGKLILLTSGLCQKIVFCMSWWKKNIWSRDQNNMKYTRNLQNIMPAYQNPSDQYDVPLTKYYVPLILTRSTVQDNISYKIKTLIAGSLAKRHDHPPKTVYTPILIFIWPYQSECQVLLRNSNRMSQNKVLS